MKSNPAPKEEGFNSPFFIFGKVEGPYSIGNCNIKL